MAYEYRRRRIRLLGLVGWMLTSLPAFAAVAGEKRAGPAIRLPDSSVEAACTILAAWNEPQVGAAIDDLGGRIAVDAVDAETVLAALAQDSSAEFATLRAELLVWAARGEPSQRPGQSKNEPKPNVLPTQRLGELAGPLLDHSDPFVRGMAEWAIAIRLGADYEGAHENVGGRQVAKEWPSTDGPAWYARWASSGLEPTLEWDYVRQAAALGWHRNTAALLKSAEILVSRADGLLSYLGQIGTPEQYADAKSRMPRVQDARQKLLKAAQSSPSNLIGQPRRRSGLA